MTRHLAIGFVALCAATACGDAELVLPPPEPAKDADEQLERALAGDLDPEARRVDDAIRAALSNAELQDLGAIDWSAADATMLLEDEAWMRAWEATAAELVPVQPRHLSEHPDCSFVDNVVNGWAHAIGAKLDDMKATPTAGAAVSAVVLYFAKKTAETFDTGIDAAYTFSAHCAEDPSGPCGVTGTACCAGVCTDGSLCLAGDCV